MTAGVSDQWHSVITDRLLELYRRYLGEPEQLSDVYIGFTLFFGGVAMAALGVVVFLWSSTLPARPGIYWQLREIAISLAMLGLPAFMLGVVVLLPTDRRALAGSGVGAAVCLGAVALFVANYPRNWNAPGADASATGVTVYAVGVVLATGAVGAALVSNYIAQSGGAPRAAQAPEDGSTAEATASEESVTESQVRADIDDAMSQADLSWGGVEKDDTKRLKIRTDEDGIDRSGFDATGGNESRAAGSDVDAAVDGLQQLRGGKTDEATGEGTDDQADALRQLRERQAADAEGDSSEGVVSKLRDKIGF